MKAWAQRNPFLARVLLRFVLRLGVALAVVIPAMPLAEAYGVSPNVAAIAAVDRAGGGGEAGREGGDRLGPAGRRAAAQERVRGT